MMASSQALIKYYDTLKDSFNVIQNTKKSEALVNAALRPKIGEEFAKSKDVLLSYLDYIQVFCIIYDETFPKICSTIVVPLFKCYPINFEDDIKSHEPAPRIHHTIKTILKAKTSLSIAYISSVTGNFPNIDDDSYSDYAKNSLYSVKYLNQETSSILFDKIVEKIDLKGDAEKIDSAYELIYEFFESTKDSIADKFFQIIQDYVTAKLSDNMRLNYMMLYVCSKDDKHVDSLLTSLWNVFLGQEKSVEERVGSVNYASSFIARANYINLDVMFDYMDRAIKWCLNVVDQIDNDAAAASDIFLSRKLAQSIFYLISQRHRELYEQDTIHRMKELNLAKLLKCRMNPLEECCNELSQRFREVVALYQIAEPEVVLSTGPKVKRPRLSSQHENKTLNVPFKEDCDKLPSRIQDLYRKYYHHANFTLYRE